jgi:ribosomal protein S18 acetylase RimI-like enzyme
MTAATGPIILIREASPEDVDPLVPLLAALFAIESDFEIDPERQRQGLALLLEDKDHAVVFVAESVEEKRIVGMATAQRLVSTAEGGYAALVEDVIVHEHFRRHGIGRRLMKALISWARKNALTRLQLLYDTSNPPALLFYESLSFQKTGLSCVRMKGLTPFSLLLSPA